MAGSGEHRDRVRGCRIAVEDDPRVSPGPQRLGEAQREFLVIHPDSEPPARYPRLRDLENRAPDLPMLPDERLVHLDPLGREVFAKLAARKRSADLLLPPSWVSDGTGVDGFAGLA